MLKVVKKRGPFQKARLEEVIDEILWNYNLPNGCKIRFELKERGIRADKEIRWIPFEKGIRANMSLMRESRDQTVKGFFEAVKARIDGLVYDEIILFDPSNKKVENQTLIETVRKMPDILTHQEVEAQRIFESVKKELKINLRISKGNPSKRIVMESFMCTLCEQYPIEEIENYIQEQREWFEAFHKKFEELEEE